MSEKPASLVATLEAALALHQQGRFAPARALYQPVLELAPDHFDALYMRGLPALQERDDDTAHTLTGKALEINPAHAVARPRLARGGATFAHRLSVFRFS